MTITDGSDAKPWGAELKAWREAQHWTRAELKERVEAASYQLKETRGNLLDTRLIARWERGEVRRPQNVYLRLLSFIGAPVPDTQTALESEAPAGQASSLWQPSIDTGALITEFTRKDLSMNRRDLHRLLGAVFIGGPLLDHLERWLTAPTHSSPGKATLSAIGSQEISELETAARMFRDWDERFGGGLRRKAVIGQLNEVSEMVSDAPTGAIRSGLYRIMAQLSETAAMMSWDSGLQAAAQRYYVLSIRAARAGGDDAFAAHAMAGMARQLLYLGQPVDALEVIRLAQAAAANADNPRLESMLAAREAWCYAHLNRIGAFERAAGRAEQILTDSGPNADEPYWIQYFDAAELHGTIGGRYLEVAERGQAGHANAAIGRINIALDSREGGRLRSSALDLIGLSQAYMLSGDLDEGARLGAEALSVAGNTSSDRVRVMLRDFHQNIGQHSKSMAVRQLRGRVAETLSTGGAV